ncbi:HEAT repeat domain-containing protein [Actinomadura sp. NPDC048394]|uniref:HEAT repeat domain-containing protein n=1 Tax=Actinomadura sp. NPDC048394 TaxID=3158223 RepID=UPI0033DAD108
MSIEELMRRLAAKETQRAAADELVALGEPAVRPVLDALCDEESPVEWSTSATILRRIGRPALEPLMEAMAAAPTHEVARRAGWAYSGLEIDDLAAFEPGLRHPSPKVRSDTAYVMQLKGERALPYAPRLIEMLADPDDDVRQRAQWALDELGPEVVPLLREVRRSRTAGRLRRPALVALASAGGPEALDERDLALVRRLVRIKMRDEVPEPMHLDGSWFALPTGDQDAVLDAFGLSDPEPVTMRMGAAAWGQEHHGWGWIDSHRMYVTPRFDGWTLVFGCPGDDDDDTELRDTVLAWCERLSARFGAAHWYGTSCGDGWTAWCIAEQGRVVRYYDAFEEDDQVGTGHPAEDGYLLPHEDGFPDDAFDGVDTSDSEAFRARYEQVKAELGIPDTCEAPEIAARASVDPSALGPGTRVEGHGVLALTATGREEGHPRGALPI